MDRPYCKSELLDLEKDVYSRYRVGSATARHVPCKHNYRVKQGGRKEEYINLIGGNDETSAVMDDQTCSVCYRIRTTNESDLPTLPSTVETLEDINKLAKYYSWLYCHNY